MSPTALFLLAALPAVTARMSTGTGGRGGGVPGVVEDWVGWEGYTGYYPPASQIPIFSHILALGLPTAKRRQF